jgi:hypothetical protein
MFLPSFRIAVMDQSTDEIILRRIEEIAKMLHEMQKDFDYRVKEIEKWIEIQKYRMDDVLLTKSAANKITTIWSLFVLAVGVLSGAAGAELFGR